MTVNALQEFILKDMDNYLEIMPIILTNEGKVPEQIK